jgi:methyl-accepting chemotaxis protein
MATLQNLPVSRKFTYAFGIVCGLCILLGIYTFTTFHEISAKNKDVSEQSLPSLVHLSDIRDSLNALRRADLDLLLCQTPACTNQETASRQKAIQEYDEATKAMQPFVTTPEERGLFEQLLAH